MSCLAFLSNRSFQRPCSLLMLAAWMSGTVALFAQKAPVPPPFPEELIGIQTQYFRSLEPVMDEHRKKMSELRRAYYKELQALGKHYVQSQNQPAALAVKIEMQKLESQTRKLPAPSTEPPRDLMELRERYEEHKFRIEESEERLMGDMAKQYTDQLAVWSKLYRDRGKKESAQAVDAEIRRIENSLKGEPAPAATPPAVPSVAAESEAPVMVDGASVASTTGVEPMIPDPLDAALTEAGTPDAAAPKEEAPPELAPPPEGLTLMNGWQGTAESNRAFANELSGLLAPYGTPQINLKTFPGLILYGNVRYLMPWVEARKALELEGKLPETGVIDTPGWPGNSSLKFYRYKGSFDGQFTAMTIVVDAQDQVVTLQLSADSKDMNLGFLKYRPLLPEWRFFDYVFGKEKDQPVEGVWHILFARNLMGEFTEETENIVNANTPCLRIDSAYFGADLKIITKNRWYVVKPFMDTLLYSCGNAE